MDPAQPSIQSQPEIIIPQSKPDNLKKIIFSILVLITLSLITYLIFQNQKLQKQVLNPPISPTVQAPSPTPKKGLSISIPVDETAGWKTYTNQKCKYSVKFPINWEKVNDPMVGEEAVYFKPMNTDLISSDDASIFIQANLSKIMGVTNLQDKIDNYNKYLWKNLTNKKIEKISFGNTNSIKVTGNNYGVPNIEILILANDCYYEIKGVGDYIQTFNQILSTFKFVEQTTNDLTIIKNFVQDIVFEYGKTHGLNNKNQIIITVNKIQGNFASGTAAFTPDVEGSGGGWFVTKINDQWIMVEQTQEPPSCKLMTQYNFPKSIYGECIEK